MSYVNPHSSVFKLFPTASGPGIHADEADSALPSLAKYLPRGVTIEIAAQAAWPASSVRENPEESEAKEPPQIVPRQHLYHPAMLITGMWGKEPDLPSRRRKMLPEYRENPSTRSDLGFWDRMTACRNELAPILAEAIQRYDQKGTSPDPRSRPWVKELSKCIAAVEYVLTQQGQSRPTILKSVKVGGKVEPLPFGMTWGVVSAKGNKKLPFAAYSEFPMVTCQGAGACAVTMHDAGGYCYSFKALRYPSAFSRFFLNTLANYADREFAMIWGTGKPEGPQQYEARVNAALRGSQIKGARIWPGYVKGLVLAATKVARQTKRSFLRLFVDGDINYEDCIIEWMNVCREMNTGSPDVAGEYPVDVYGYSKCWQQFLNVDSIMRTDAQRRDGRETYGNWPTNYTVNMSDGSFYNLPQYSDLRKSMEVLPVTRGFFEVIQPEKYIPKLISICRASADCANLPIKIPSDPAQMPFQFSESRIRMLLAINAIQTIEDAKRLFPRLHYDKKELATPEKIREKVYNSWISALISPQGEWSMSGIIKQEILRDKIAGGEKVGQTEEGALDEETYLDAKEKKAHERIERIVSDERAGIDIGKRRLTMKKYFDALASGQSIRPLVIQSAMSKKALSDKALAMVLHETFWALGIGGSCPLVCGNCSDDFTDPKKGVHRCASKTVFRDRIIHIGLH